VAITPLAWAEMAACRGSEGSVFFAPDSSERKDERVARELVAKRICAGCCVREECLESALARHESHGVWGGLNELERRSFVRG
jgi:WhiB family transcriptional regulator, redox-sensing transcriptional regulator